MLPVEVGPIRQLVPGQISENCRKAVPPGNKAVKLTVTMNGVKFLCHPDSNSYIVAVGLKDGESPMKLRRPDGGTATYGIIYRNVTANPDIHDLQEILNTFQLR